jgi:NADH-quinone oxidoreductase subunit H
MWIRGTWPRFRIDQMLGFAWKVLVPASLASIAWVAIVVKLPVPQAVQYLLMLAGSLATGFVCLTLLGRAARRFVEGQEAAAHALAAQQMPAEA